MEGEPARFRLYNLAHRGVVTLLVGAFLYTGFHVYAMTGELHAKRLEREAQARLQQKQQQQIE